MDDQIYPECRESVLAVDDEATITLPSTSSTPIQIIHKGDLHLIAPEGSTLQLIVQGDLHLTLEPGAKVELLSTAQNQRIHATLHEKSHLKGIHILHAQHDFHITLAGESACVELSGLWFLEPAQVTVFVDHQKPHTQSHQNFKGVLDGANRSRFAGKILIRQAAQKSVAMQKNHNLLLSDTALAKSEPHLEIFADDVKATHGATIGHLDEEQLFYLKSRGLSHEIARRLQIYGFVQEIIRQIPIISIQKRFDEIVSCS